MNQNDNLPARIAVVSSFKGSEAVVSALSAANVRDALGASFPVVEVFPLTADLDEILTSWKPDVVFPVAHGQGESGALQQLLTSLGTPFVGSDETSSALC